MCTCATQLYSYWPASPGNMITVGRKLSLSATLSFSLHQSKHICPPSEKFNVSLKRSCTNLGSKFTATTRLTGLVWWMAKLETIPCQLSVCAAEGPKTLASIVDTTQDNVAPENTWISRWTLRSLAVPPPWQDSRWHRERATPSVELLARSWSISFRKAQVKAFLTVLHKLAN